MPDTVRIAAEATRSHQTTTTVFLKPMLFRFPHDKQVPRVVVPTHFEKYGRWHRNRAGRT